MELHIVREQSKEEGKQVQHKTQDTVWQCKVTKTHHKQGSQEASPFLTGDHKAARNRHGRQDTLNPA